MEYDDIRKNVLKLPFIHLHSVHNQTDKNIIMPTASMRSSRRLEKILDYMISARICLESKLKWCLMVEEYSIFPRDFLDSLKRHVIAPLDTLLITRDVDEVVSIFSLK